MSRYPRTQECVAAAEAAPARTWRADRRGVLLGLVAVQLTILPWAFGGVDEWALIVNGALGLLILTLGSGAPQQSATGKGRTARDPVLWTGVALAAYIACQALNPAYRYAADAGTWWLEPLSPIAWLPAGMRVPLLQSGPWRTLLLWFPPWAALVALRRVGLSSRTAAFLLQVLAVNAGALAVFGVLQRAAGVGTIYGLRPVPTAQFFASFIYRNHAATYLNLGASAAFALATRSFTATRREVRSGMPLVYLMLGLVILAGVALSYSLAAAVLAAGCAVVLVPATCWSLARRRSTRRTLAIVGGVVAVVVGTAGAILPFTAGGTRIRQELAGRITGDAALAWKARVLARRETVAMWRDRAVFGWGAGCYRYGFSKYQRRDPQLNFAGTARLRWEHAHNDALEILAEIGVVGASLLFVGLATLFGRALKCGVASDPPKRWLGAGLLVLASHAMVDFPFQNPAILATAAVILAIVVGTEPTTVRVARRTVEPGRNPS